MKKATYTIELIKFIAQILFVVTVMVITFIIALPMALFSQGFIDLYFEKINTIKNIINHEKN